MTTPASPQPGNRDEREHKSWCQAHPAQNRPGWACHCGADQPGTGGEAERRYSLQEVADEFGVDLDTEFTPSAGQAPGPWRVGQHYGLHVYEGDRPVATFHRPEDAARTVAAVNATKPAPDDHSAAGNATRRQEAGQDTERLRDELIDQAARTLFTWEFSNDSAWCKREAGRVVDRLLDGPLWQLIAERDEARAQVQRVRELSTELEREAARGAHPARREAADRLCRALGGTTGRP